MFLARFTKSTNDKAFWLLYKNLDEIRKIMEVNPNYVPAVIEYNITKEEIDLEVLAASKSETLTPELG